MLTSHVFPQVRYVGSHPAHTGQRLDPPRHCTPLPQSQPVSACFLLLSLWLLLCNYSVITRTLCQAQSRFLFFCSLFVSEMATNSCTAQLGPSAWLTWPGVTCTGSTRGAPCSPWAPSCSARAVSFLHCTGASHKHNCLIIIINYYIQMLQQLWASLCRANCPAVCLTGRWLRRNRRNSRWSVWTISRTSSTQTSSRFTLRLETDPRYAHIIILQMIF